MNTHSLQRLRDRVLENNVPISEIDVVISKLEKLANEAKKDLAVLIYRFRREQVSDLSNGDEVWAIVRNNDVVTIMLRRSTQPKTNYALRVAQVVTRF